MDKKNIGLIAILVILIFIFWPALQWFGVIKPRPAAPAQTADTSKVIDTTKVATADSVKPQTPAAQETVRDTTTVPAQAEVPADTSVRRDTITVTTHKYVIQLSTYGGGPVSIKLRDHHYRNGVPIEMLPGTAPATPEAQFANGTVSTARLNFTPNVTPGNYDATTKSQEITFTYTSPSGGQLIKRYIFDPDRYDYMLVVEAPNLSKLGFERQYDLVWNHPLGATEPDSSSDFQSMEAVALMSKSREVLNDFNKDTLNQSLTGSTSWAGVRAKYFAAVMIPRNRTAEGVYAKGFQRPVTSSQGKAMERQITVGMELPFAGAGVLADSFTIFVGPLDYTLLASYNVELEDMLGIGTTAFVGWIIKPFALAVIWLLPRMYDFIPNYGFVIIIFALLIKIVTLPLSLKSFRSMQAMKDIQPKVDELKKRHKNNPQQLNTEMMKLYKEAGVNPFSGCIPMLLQMPLFFGLFSVFRSTILLRDAPFIGFINDLSRGASGLTDPYIILVVLMVVFQFISQKLTMAQNQQNKMLMYLMPLMFAFFFYKLSAGLVLYWASFSLFSLMDYFLYKRTHKNPEVQTA